MQSLMVTCRTDAPSFFFLIPQQILQINMVYLDADSVILQHYACLQVGQDAESRLNQTIQEASVVDLLRLNFLSLTFNNHILCGSDALRQLFDEAADGCGIVQEWKNPEGFCGSSCRPQPSNGHKAHHSRIFEGLNFVDMIHIELP